MRGRKFLLVGILFVAMLATVGVAGCTVNELQAIEGVIQNIDTVSGNVTVELKDGSTQTFNFADVKAGTIKQTLGSLSIAPGDTVTIKEDQNGNVKEVGVENAEVDGVIKSLGADSVTVTTGKKGDITLAVTPETVIRIEDKGTAALGDLKVGQQVEAKYDVGSLEALKIKVEIDNEDGGELKGTIESINTSNTTVTINTEKKGDIPLKITSGTVIRIEDKGTAALGDLKVGQQVKAKYDVGSLEALKIKVDEEAEKPEKDVEDEGNQSLASDNQTGNHKEAEKPEKDVEDEGNQSAASDNQTGNHKEAEKPEKDVEDEAINNVSESQVKGTIESLSPDGNSMVVNGQTILIQDAEIDGVLIIGATVEAEVVAQPDGSLVTQEIKVKDEGD